MGETNEKEPPPLKIDPKCVQDALRAFLPPIKNDDSRLDFYNMYKKEATEYDTDYVKKYDDDLNTTLIFAGLFSAVSSAFVLDVQSKLEPDPNEQSAALLRAILLTLNRSAIPGGNLTVPPLHEDTPSGITAASCLIYASLMVSLLAAFIAMLGKQWLNRYIRNTGRSTIERCGDRQRKLQGLERWPFHAFVESLPVMLQIALLLLACGLCRQMVSVNTSVAGVLIALTALGILFYLGIVVAGASSYDCPFQTPASTALRNSWKGVRPRVTPVVFPIICALRSLWDTIFCQIFRIALRLLLKLDIRRQFRRPYPPNVGGDSPSPRFVGLRGLWKKVRSGILRVVLHLQLAIASTLRHYLYCPPLPTIQNGSLVPREHLLWLTPKDLAVFLNNNASDGRCVSWILGNTTDPETVDAAVRLACTIRWFDGPQVEPPYDAIISVFWACFDSAKTVYPGLEDRAYHSLRAILWMHALAKCKSQELARRFPLPFIGNVPPCQNDLTHLLSVCPNSNALCHNADPPYSALYTIPHESNTAHAQWTSNLLLHLAWTKQGDPDVPRWFRGIKSRTGYRYNDWDTIPLNVTLNRFLVWCIFLGSPIEEEVLRIQDKSDRLERIVTRLHRAIIAAIAVTTNSCHESTLLPDILHSLTTWKSRPSLFSGMAYEWCSVIRERYPDLEVEGGRGRLLLFLSLEIGFRHLGFRNRDVEVKLTHLEGHRKVVDVVFKDGSDEVIADFLCACTSRPCYGTPPVSLHTFASHLVDPQRLQPFSPRLRHLLISAIGLIGYEGFERVGGEKFFKLLDRLCVRAEDVDSRHRWGKSLLGVIRSPEGIHRLSYPYWELLVELLIPGRGGLKYESYSHYIHIMESLEDAEEWDRLECWIGSVWVLWGPDSSLGGAANLESASLSLFRQRPGGVRKLERWIERNSCWTLELFRSMCEREGLDVAGPHTPVVPLADGRSGEPSHSPLAAVPLSFVGDDTF